MSPAAKSLRLAWLVFALIVALLIGAPMAGAQLRQTPIFYYLDETGEWAYLRLQDLRKLAGMNEALAAENRSLEKKLLELREKTGRT